MKGTFPERILIAAAVLSLAGLPAAAQGAGDSDLARRTFLNAEQLMREGKLEQAIRDYQQVVQAFPESLYADDALMRLGSHHYPPESLWDLASVDRAGQEAARPYFEQVRERYPQSDSAPRALHKLGLLALEPHSASRNLDEAYASFSRVVNIYPDSPWVGPALLGAAYSEIGKNNYDRAILSLERALDETPRGPASAQAHYFLGLSNARLGDHVRAAEAFQQCRLEDPDGPTAGSALDWLTLLHKTRLRPGSGRPPRYAYDSQYVPRVPAGEDLRGELRMAVAPEGDLVVADPRRGALLTFDRDGKLKGSEPFPDVGLVAFDAFGSLVAVGRERITLAGGVFAPSRQDRGKTKPVEEVGGVWRGSRKETYVLDLGEGELLLYEGDPSSPRVLASDKGSGARMEVMAAGPEDRLYFLDGKGKRLMALDDGGLRPLGPAEGAGAFERPVDLAADGLGNLYVLDSRRKAVVVVGPDGGALSTIQPPEGAPQAFEDPGCLAVGPSGEVYVYDKRKRTILLFR